jgi:hypothetical protein
MQYFTFRIQTISFVIHFKGTVTDRAGRNDLFDSQSMKTFHIRFSKRSKREAVSCLEGQRPATRFPITQDSKIYASFG